MVCSVRIAVINGPVRTRSLPGRLGIAEEWAQSIRPLRIGWRRVMRTPLQLPDSLLARHFLASAFAFASPALVHVLGSCAAYLSAAEWVSSLIHHAAPTQESTEV